MSSWSINGVSAEVLGLSVRSATFHASGADELSLIHVPGSYADGLVLEFGDSVHVQRNGRSYFRGRVTRTPRMAQGSQHEHGYQVLGGWHELTLYKYRQASKWVLPSGVAAIPSTRVRLGIIDQDTTPKRANSREVIRAILSHAISCGAYLQIGSLLHGVMIPTTDWTDVTHADLLSAVLRFHPDAVAWVDHETDPPTFNVRRRGQLDAVRVPGGNHPVSGCRIVPREDLLPTGVTVDVTYGSDGADAGDGSFESELAVGAPKLRRRTTPAGANLNSARHLFISTDISGKLGGKTAETMPPNLSGAPQVRVQTCWLKTRPLPEPGMNTTREKGFWYGILPMVRHLRGHISRDDLHISSQAVSVDVEDAADDPPTIWSDPDAESEVVSTDPADYPNYFRAGKFPDWLKRRRAPVVCSARVWVPEAVLEAIPDAVERDRAMQAFPVWGRPANASGDDATWWRGVDVSVRVTGTDASTGHYSRPVSFSNTMDAPEDDPLSAEDFDGVQDEIYDALSTLHYEGVWSLTEASPSGRCRPGRVLNVVHGKRPEWARMRALILSTMEDWESGLTEISFGPPADFREWDDAAANVGLASLVPSVAPVWQQAEPRYSAEPRDSDMQNFFDPIMEVQTSGNQSAAKHPWFLTGTGSGVKVESAVVTDGLREKVPQVSGVGINTAPGPVLSLSGTGTRDVYVRIELEPEKAKGDDEKWVMVPGGKLVGECALSSSAGSPQAPAVDEVSGAVTNAVLWVLVGSVSRASSQAEWSRGESQPLRGNLSVTLCPPSSVVRRTY